MSGIRALQQQLNFGDRAPPMGPRPVNKKPIEYGLLWSTRCFELECARSPDPSPALAHVTASRAKPQAGRRPPTRRTGITASVASSSVFSTAAADSDDSELEELKRSNEDLLQDNDRLVEQMEEAEQRHSAELERLNEEIRRLRETQSAAKPVAEPPQAAAALPRSFKVRFFFLVDELFLTLQFSTAAGAS